MATELDSREQSALSSLAQIQAALVAELERAGLGHLQDRIPDQLTSHDPVFRGRLGVRGREGDRQ